MYAHSAADLGANEAQHYDKVTVVLHWLTATLIFFQFASAHATTTVTEEFATEPTDDGRPQVGLEDG